MLAKPPSVEGLATKTLAYLQAHAIADQVNMVLSTTKWQRLSNPPHGGNWRMPTGSHNSERTLFISNDLHDTAGRVIKIFFVRRHTIRRAKPRRWVLQTSTVLGSA